MSDPDATDATSEELRIRFTYHPPTPTQAVIYDELRSRVRALAEMIVELVPRSRERSLAVMKLEEAVMWANAAVARRSTDD